MAFRSPNRLPPLVVDGAGLVWRTVMVCCGKSLITRGLRLVTGRLPEWWRLS